jgi:hypothetical protein
VKKGSPKNSSVPLLVVGSFEIRKLIDADLSAIHDLFFPEQFELFLFKHTIREA